MGTKPWKAGAEVYTTIKTLIASHACLKDLALCDDEILVVFKEKATVTGDVVIAGKTSKANDLLGLVQETPYKFVITLAGDEWLGMADQEREALLFHHLCACGVEEDPDKGEIRFFVRLPDVSFYRDEVVNYGFWRTTGATPTATIIAELFGDEPDPQAIAAAKAARKKAKGGKGKGNKGQANP